MHFGHEVRATYISASGKGDLLRQVMVQQSNILNYLPSPSKARSANAISLDLCRRQKVMQLRPPQSISQSINQSIN